MRITNNMMITTMIRNMNQNLLRLDKRQLQAATGKKIHVPSDDPIGISRSLKIRADLMELGQYGRNVDDALSWMTTTEIALDNIGLALQRLRELTVQASNGVLTDEDTQKIMSEVVQIKEQIINLGNMAYGGRYIFSGKKTDQKLFNQNGEYQVDLVDMDDSAIVDDKMDFEIGVGETIQINVLGFEIFEKDLPRNMADDGSEINGNPKAGMIQMIEIIENKLQNGDTAALTVDIGEVDAYINAVLTVRSELGAKMNRLEMVTNRIGDDTVNFSRLQSQIEDADMGEVIMRLINEENVYRSSLGVGARIIQPTLLDFLR